MSILILLVLGLALVSLVTEDSDLALNQVQSNQAFYSAHAGIEYAVQKLAANWSWGGLAPPGKTVGNGSFWISAPDTLDETGAPLPAGRKRIVATGIVGGAQRQVQVQVESGGISTYAGVGTTGYTGDGGPAVAARLRQPQGLYVDAGGDLYFADTNNHAIRMVSFATGIITTVAGTGTAGETGDGGPATSAQLRAPQDVFVALNGDLYIADTGNDKIRKVTAATGVISTIAGIGTAGSTGDGGPATSAELNTPSGIVAAPNGDFYIGDYGSHKIRKVVAATGIISTYAGSGPAGYTGDGGPATAARLRQPQGMALAANGDLYFADTSNDVVRKVTASTGIITTVAGTGVAGYSGDGGPATAAQLRTPEAVSLTTSGDLLVAERGNNRIRRISAAGTITTVAGTGTAGFTGDGGPATAARLDTPRGVHAASNGIFYIGDTLNRRVRRVGGTLSVVAWVETRS
jgi:sugar lactone lactonase YvrE